jgi:glycine oxidase
MVAVGAGVRLVDQAVAGFDAGTVRLAGGARVDADRLVVAVGAARTDLAPELLQLAPVKGHILRMAGGPRQGPVVRAEKIYVRPHPSGAIVGASMELGRSDADIDPAIVADLAARAAALFPGLAVVQHHVATGIRATTDDGLPLIGSSVRPGVLLAVGARRNGWLLAPAVGHAVTAAAFGEEAGEADLFRRS